MTTLSQVSALRNPMNVSVVRIANKMKAYLSKKAINPLYGTMEVQYCNLPKIVGKYGSLHNQVEHIAQWEGFNLDYIVFRRVSFGKLAMYHGDEPTGYTLFIAENEID